MLSIDISPADGIAYRRRSQNLFSFHVRIAAAVRRYGRSSRSSSTSGYAFSAWTMISCAVRPRRAS